MLESYSTSEGINKDELSLLELGIDSQLEYIDFFYHSRLHRKSTKKHICDAAQLCEGSSWITCFASILDKVNPLFLKKKSRGTKVIDALLDNNYQFIINRELINKRIK